MPGPAEDIPQLRLTPLINDAVAKKPSHPLVIFVDTNLPFKWAERVLARQADAFILSGILGREFLRMLDDSYSLLLDLVGCYPVSFRTFSSQSDFLVRSCASDMCAAERILVRQPFGALRAAERGLVTSVVPDQKLLGTATDPVQI